MSARQGSDLLLFKRTLLLSSILAFLWLPAVAQEPKPGPATIALGSNLATLKLPEGFAYLDGPTTKKLLEDGGSHTEAQVLGAVMMGDEGGTIVMEYDPQGYVKDDDAGDIDADEILQGYKDGTEAQNKERKEKGIAPLTILGWGEEPHYDAKSHHLIWGLSAQSDGEPLTNYETRILGREGVLAMTLICDTKSLDSLKPRLSKILDATTFNDGKRYADYKDGDKVSEAGLLALVAGGAAAAKLGLFAKLFKGILWLLVIFKKGAIVLVMGVVALFNKLTGRGGGSAPSPAPTPPSEPSSEPPSSVEDQQA